MSNAGAITLRRPRARDAASVRRLVIASSALEPISCYGYLLLCTHFASNCLLAERGTELVGFVLGYRPPSHPDSVFVWQIGIHPDARGAGLGRRLLTGLLEQPGCRSAAYLMATVSPDNLASLGLFRGFARAHGVPCEEGTGFPAALFDTPHSDEHMLRIGPLKGRL